MLLIEKKIRFKNPIRKIPSGKLKELRDGVAEGPSYPIILDICRCLFSVQVCILQGSKHKQAELAPPYPTNYIL